MEIRAIHMCRDTGILCVLRLFAMGIPIVVRKQSRVSMPSHMMNGKPKMGKKAN